MLPLTGSRVLVTRSREQASVLAQALEKQGASVLSVPAIELAPPESWCILDAALTALGSYDWLLFTSANAVAAFAARARRLGLPGVARHVGVVGPATARAVLAEGVAEQVEVQPERFVAEALVDALADRVHGSSVLLVRAAEARDVLVEGLGKAGAQVTVATAYRNVIPEASVSALRAAFACAETTPNVATFTSASTATHLHTLLSRAGLQLPPETVTASIGPITSQALRELGWPVTVEAREATLEGLVSALADFFQARTTE